MKFISTLLLAILTTACSSFQPYNVPTNFSNYSDKPPIAGENGTFESTKANILKHALMYRAKSRDLVELASKNGEGTFYSSIVAVVAGVFNNKTLAIGGATGAAGTSMFSERYKLEVQSNHYRSVFTALECVYKASEPINTSLTPQFTFTLPPDNQIEVVSANYIRDVAVNALYKSISWIENSQLSMSLGTPNADTLGAALAQIKPKTKNSSAGATPTPPTPPKSNPGTSAYVVELNNFTNLQNKYIQDKAIYDAQLEQEDRQKNYKKEVDICLSPLS